MHLRQTFCDGKVAWLMRLSFVPGTGGTKPAFPPVLHSAVLFEVQLGSRSLLTMKLGPFVAVVIATCGLPPVLRAQKPPIPPGAVTIDALFQLREVQDPQLSPDTQWVAYTVKTLNLKEDKSEERIWIVPFGGGDAIPMTAEGVSSSQPRWSPDGKYLAFLSARNEGKTQVWLLNRSGGEAQRLTDTPQDVDDFVWSPDSTRFVVILRAPS